MLNRKEKVDIVVRLLLFVIAPFLWLSAYLCYVCPPICCAAYMEERMPPARPPPPHHTPCARTLHSTPEIRLAELEVSQVRWYYNETEADAKANKRWRSFCSHDSVELEKAYRYLLQHPDSAPVIATRGSLYDVDVKARIGTVLLGRLREEKKAREWG